MDLSLTSFIVNKKINRVKIANLADSEYMVVNC